MSTGEGPVAVLCGWEGNRRSVVALVMRQTLHSAVYACVLSGSREGDENPAYVAVAVCHMSPFTFHTNSRLWLVSDVAVFVLKRDVKLQPTRLWLCAMSLVVIQTVINIINASWFSAIAVNIFKKCPVCMYVILCVRM